MLILNTLGQTLTVLWQLAIQMHLDSYADDTRIVATGYTSVLEQLLVCYLYCGNWQSKYTRTATRLPPVLGQLAIQMHLDSYADDTRIVATGYTSVLEQLLVCYLYCGNWQSKYTRTATRLPPVLGQLAIQMHLDSYADDTRIVATGYTSVLEQLLVCYLYCGNWQSKYTRTATRLPPVLGQLAIQMHLDSYADDIHIVATGNTSALEQLLVCYLYCGNWQSKYTRTATRLPPIMGQWAIQMHLDSYADDIHIVATGNTSALEQLLVCYLYCGNWQSKYTRTATRLPPIMGQWAIRVHSDSYLNVTYIVATGKAGMCT
ncbi:hypothetical protein K1T71_002889 [Dendrolimus kikuchii]|uniref:Uncharacterized protein n=1 Tax=Dendrolimus kikuchii TaxID=765133 RepID=A0ACC1DFH0_9NEOP|nr:hypothetical protein K1T71_002889 [Dendrolimus kikuchii]